MCARGHGQECCQLPAWYRGPTRPRPAARPPHSLRRPFGGRVARQTTRARQTTHAHPNNSQRSGQPPLKKEVTAELGNVTPYVIVPGPWSDSDIAYHAANVAAGLAQNNGHNCLAAEVGRTRARACRRACIH